MDEEFIYICDTYNHRIQVLLRENGIFSSQWGSQGRSDTQFYYPSSIYFSVLESLLYIGDNYGVKIFTKEGTFLKRFGSTHSGSGEGQINAVVGILIENDQLYLSDYNNKRIQVWR